MLSQRLMCIAKETEPVDVMADIGTEHGYLTIYLIKNKTVNKAIAADISKGSCLKAEKNVKAACLEDKISVRCGDGLEPITTADNVECIAIAGMGGMLTIHILESNLPVVNAAKRIILQPQKDIFKVRKYIHNIGFKIVNEQCLWEDGKFYNIVNAVKGKEDEYSEKEYYLGKFNIERKPQAYIDFLNTEIKKIEKVIENMKVKSADKDRIKELMHLKEIYGEGLK